MNEAYDFQGNASDALFTLRLIVGQGDNSAIVDMYEEAALRHGACPSDCREAIAEGRRDRTEAEAASLTTLLTVGEIITDLHTSLVADRRRRKVIGAERGTRYYVCDENTLCYQILNDSMAGVMACIMDSKGRLGRDPLDGITALETFRTVRPATLEDFKTFRVRPEGHIVH